MPPEGAASAVPEPAARRTATEWFAAFMEQRNLNWGELVGGLLIVCGSIALVLSFWSQIAERPFLKFFVFNGFTAALFGLGRYASARLKLPTTSRAFFSIATLLVPLNFLALAAFSRDAQAESLATIAGDVVSIALFAWLTWRAGGTITPETPLLLSLGIVGPSIAGLLIRRFISSESGIVAVLSLGLMPVAIYAATLGTALWKSVREGTGSEPDEQAVRSQFRLLGTATFACAAPLGLLASRTGDIAGTLRWLAPLGALFAAPSIAVGLSLWKRVVSAERTTTRVVASGVAIAGTLILLAGVVLAWPHPGMVLLVALVNFAVLSAIAYLQKLPVAHLAALPCAGLAYLLAVHLGRRDLAWELLPSSQVSAALLSAESGTALVPLAAIFGAAAAWLRRSHPEDSRFHSLVAGITAVVSLALATVLGLGRTGDPAGATWVFGIYGLALIAVAAIWEQRVAAAALALAPDVNLATVPPAAVASGPQISRTMLIGMGWGGAILLLIACVQGAAFLFVDRFHLAHPWIDGLLTQATVVLV
ncbi:MAG: hypothetical protein EHM42_09900, partial [Planctomycetaceae bacterium]